MSTCSSEEKEEDGNGEGNNRKYSVQFSPKLGRYLRADGDLEGQEVIIDEVPLLVAPSGQHEWHSESHRPLSICIGCLKSQDEKIKFQKCAQCSWPVCSTDCVGIGKFHSEEECLIFKTRGIIQSPRTLKMIYILRCCLMQEKDPAKWTKLQDLASSPEVTAIQDEEDAPATAGSSEESHRSKEYEFLVEVCGMTQFDEQLVRQLCGVRRVNGFSFYNSEADELRFYGMAVYYETSMASHGCSPNLTTQVVYNPAESFPMRLRTKTAVGAGEILQIAYRDRWLVLGTLRRREKIFHDHKFQCQCGRCEDPTEGATFFSAFACAHCAQKSAEDPSENKIGPLENVQPNSCCPYVLPKNPLEPSSPWECRECHGEVPESEISAIIEEVTEDTERILESADGAEEKFLHLSDYLMDGTARVRLHPNNYLLLRLELEWIRLFPWDVLEDEQENWEEPQHWQLFLALVERGEHCKRVYGRLIPDWEDKNSFVDVALGRAYYLYYLQQNRLPNLQSDLILDLVKICLAHVQKGARHQDSPSSELAKLCFTIVTALGNVKRLLRSQSCDKANRLAGNVNACD